MKMLLLSLACLAGPGLASAQAPLAGEAAQWYRVELVIFAHEPGAAAVNEVFLADLAPEPPDPSRVLQEIDLSFTDRPDWLAILHTAQEDSPAEATLEELVLPRYWQVLSREQSRLTAVLQRLQRQQDYRPLMQMTWEQAVEANAEGLVIDIGEAVLGSAEMIGTVTLSRSRFLHLNLDLEYVPENRPPAQILVAQGGPLVDARLQVPRYRLAESRRLRSGEMHYFDHPAFGVIALVTPIDGRASAAGNLR
jgi:hypothetical protein